MITSAQEFFELCNSEDPALYQRMRYDSASEEVWWEIIQTYPNLTQWVILNKTVPTNILVALAEDEDPATRRWVAIKRKTPPTVLQKLAKDPDEAVRLGVATNRKTPAYILEELLNDEWDSVVEVVKERLEELRSDKQDK